MPTEIEAKIKVERLEPYVRRLERLQARSLGKVVQRDHFFDRPEGILKQADSALRLRQESHPGRTETIMAFKGPCQAGGNYKRRTEIQFTVGDLRLARKLLEVLGYIQVFVFEKRRHSWQLDDCTVCLDELDELGTFIEIEGPDEAAIGRTAAKLELDPADHIPASYLRMNLERLNGDTSR